MTPELEVDTAAVRAWAAALSATVARISSAAPGPPTGPHWSSTEAAQVAADAARVQLQVLTDGLAATARQAAAAADEYEDADDRAAARLRKI